LAYFADLLSSPRKDALLGLASCASDEAQAARLKLLASAQGKAEYTSYIAKPHRSLLEVGGCSSGVSGSGLWGWLRGLERMGRAFVCGGDKKDRLLGSSLQEMQAFLYAAVLLQIQSVVNVAFRRAAHAMKLVLLLHCCR
jgi:hypothetical protein